MQSSYNCLFAKFQTHWACMCLRNGSVFQEGLGKYNKSINVQVEEMVVFLHRTEPDLEFEGLLKRRHTQIKYLSVAFASTIDFKQF